MDRRRTRPPIVAEASEARARRRASRCASADPVQPQIRGEGAAVGSGAAPLLTAGMPVCPMSQSRSWRSPVLRQVAEGVLVHESEFLQSNAVVVQGRAGVLLIDPGVLGSEMAVIADDLRELGQPVVAGFSTHPHWDHLLWHDRLGAAPRYGTARCAATVRVRLSDAGAKARIAELIPPDIAEQVPLDLLGRITGLPAETAPFPW